MTLPRRESGSQADNADHDQDDRVRVAEIEVASPHLVKQEEHAKSYDDRRAHQTTAGARLA
jgi:hypothetical protein